MFAINMQDVVTRGQHLPQAGSEVMRLSDDTLGISEMQFHCAMCQQASSGAHNVYQYWEEPQILHSHQNK